jgi:dienelactone hydrolase
MTPSPSMKMAEAGDPRFAYDTTDTLDIQEAGEEVFDGIAVHDINFRGASGRRVNAYLVTPMIGHSFPGVLFVHPLPGSRKSFLDEAMKLADSRICSLAVDAPWSAGMEWAKGMGDPEHDRMEFIGTIKDLRRSFDVLTSQSSVDPSRLGYVGHSLGALCGAVLSGVDHRAKAYVLMSGTSSFSDVAQVNMPDLKDEKLDRYKQVLSDIDPIRFVPEAAPAIIMFQMGTNEEYFGRQRMRSLAHAGSEPKVVHWYDASHMLDEQARRDRDGWLVEELFR